MSASGLPFLVYGATGYTGRLTSDHAVARGLRPILAGRDGARTVELAGRLHLDARAFSLDSPAAIAEGIRGAAAVLHAAGPFSATSKPMADACLAAGVHYVDITGEIDVFEALAARDAEARARGVMLLPGAGFDVVPSDCLAAHVARRLPGATRLRISIGGLSTASRGTAKTMIEGAGRGTRVRRDGRIVELARAPRGSVDFGAGPRPTIGVSWGDVATAWRSTGIPDIEVAFEASPRLERAAAMPRPVRRLLATRLGQRLAKRQVDRRLAPGPSAERRARTRSVIVAEAWDAGGKRAASRLETAEAYTLTAWTAVEIARRAAAGEAPTGYRTPATAFGPDFVLGFEGSTRRDLEAP